MTRQQDFLERSGIKSVFIFTGMIPGIENLQVVVTGCKPDFAIIAPFQHHTLVFHFQLIEVLYGVYRQTGQFNGNLPKVGVLIFHKNRLGI